MGYYHTAKIRQKMNYQKVIAFLLDSNQVYVYPLLIYRIACK